MYIDDNNCRNCKRCIQSYPEIFELKDNFGEQQVRIKSGVTEEDLEEVAGVCQNHAIYIG